MCGIIAIVRRRARRAVPAGDEIVERLASAEAIAGGLRASERAGLPDGLRAIADAVAPADELLRGVPGVSLLVSDRRLTADVHARAERLERSLAELDRELDTLAAGEGLSEQLNAALLAAKDAVWPVGHDRVRTARAVADLAGAGAGGAAIEVFTSVQQALSALERLEVRGRDAAGIHLLVRGHGLDVERGQLAGAIHDRADDPLFRSGAIRVADGCLGFVYKAAAEIGELGDNVRELREAIAADDILHQALTADTAEAVVLGHTRWASVGIISEPNAHPLDSLQSGRATTPYVAAVLNGDVDNFADLKAADALSIATPITTDAKVIPTLISERLAAGVDLDEAFRSSVARFEGSVAIAAGSVARADGLHLALRGSGQALYVGLAEDSYVVASEPYGLVEETSTYLRLDGETPANPENPTTSRGQIVSLAGSEAGTLAGITRWSYDGTVVPVSGDDLVRTEITTRDIDRGDHPHFLLKEISEAPTSFRKTLRGRIIERDGSLTVQLGDATLPGEIRAALRDGSISAIEVVGQGTAAVAGQSVVHALRRELEGSAVTVTARLATELSGFALRNDMADTLVIAISQSGSTTDTNRTVDLVRSRGARVVSIVNRRGSDLTDKSDGVLYTSDGRDVEMSVASTKAFYSQIAAGFLLAAVIADEVLGPGTRDKARQALLRALLELPEAMEQVVASRAAIGDAARRSCLSRRYWAIVGNGRNRVAAEELRIKLSELCYKSIACDATEDKKHIDLSSEPMILVCAAGLRGSTADDVAKEVEIYRAHKAAPVVITDEDLGRFTSAIDVIPVPAVHGSVAFVLSAMAGHLFGYEAARAIDEQAQPLREARVVIEHALDDELHGDELLEHLASELAAPARRYFDGLRRSLYDGHLEASTATRLVAALRYAVGIAPLDSYQIDHGKVGTPGVVVEDLTEALTLAIGELTRPIDAIKHQAKTVTVGISRADETLLQIPLVEAVLAAGSPRDSLSYRSLRTLASLDPAISEVTGFTRYRVEGDVAGSDAETNVVDRGGVSVGLISRTATEPLLRGTKHQVATDQEVLVTAGRRDGRTIVIVPEVKDKTTVGLTLLHVKIADRLDADVMRSVLQGYRNRYGSLRDAVMETEPTFQDHRLGEMSPTDLLVATIPDLGDRWRS